MNKESDNDCSIWKNNEVWSFLNSNNDLVGSGEKFTSDKLPDQDPNRSDICPLTTINTAEKKRNASNRKKGSKRNGKAKSGAADGEGESDLETHIMTERERRKKMMNMFSNLHALLPQLPPKADKCSIVDEAIKYIKVLKNTYDELNQQKEERLKHGVVSNREAFMADQGSTSNSAAVTPTSFNIPIGFQTWNSPNLVVNVCGEDAHISVCCPKKPGLFREICCVLGKYKIEIVSAQVSSDHYRNMLMIQARANPLSEALPVEEIYKQAASEIMPLVT